MNSEYKTFVCSYKYRGLDWDISVVATSFEDAQARLRAMGTSGVVDGILYAEIPVPSIVAETSLVHPLGDFLTKIVRFFRGG